MTIRPCAPFWHKMPSFIQGYCIVVLISYDWHLALSYMEDSLAGRNERITENKAIKWDRITQQQCTRLCNTCISCHGIEFLVQVQGHTASKGKSLLCLGNCPERLFSIIGDHILRCSEHVYFSMQPKGRVIGFLLHLLQLKKVAWVLNLCTHLCLT